MIGDAKWRANENPASSRRARGPSNRHGGEAGLIGSGDESEMIGGGIGQGDKREGSVRGEIGQGDESEMIGSGEKRQVVGLGDDRREWRVFWARG